MRLVISMNIPSPHQIPLGQALADRLPGNFALICAEPVHAERLKLGWQPDFNASWLIKTWVSASERTRALDIFRSADVAVWGYVPVSEINNRVAKGKLTFFNSERLFKQGKWRLGDPRVIRNLIRMFGRNQGSHHHLLAIGPYCAEDYRLIGAFRGRIWRWGYFPELPQFVARNPASVPVVLWAGRMLSWKRVDLLLSAAAWARNQGGGRFHLRLIGYGPEEERLRSLAARLGLLDICEFLGPQNPDEVGKAMEKADIYVFPSDQQEGWGAVVNEAMSRGCCVIGCKSAGAVPWLIRDGVNGYVFDGNSAENLGRILYRCIENLERTRGMGIAARATISNLWSPTVAAERLIQLCESMESGKPSPFSDGGPCSPV